MHQSRSPETKEAIWMNEHVSRVLRGLEQRYSDETIFLQAAEAYGAAVDYSLGANIAGFIKVAQAMMAQGAV